MTALPRSPGCGPAAYQPVSFHGFFVGVAKSPLASNPKDSIAAFTLIEGISRRTGVAKAAGFVLAGEVCGEGEAVGDGNKCVLVVEGDACNDGFCTACEKIIVEQLLRTLSVRVAAKQDNSARSKGIRITCFACLLRIVPTLHLLFLLDRLFVAERASAPKCHQPHSHQTAQE